MEKTEWKLERYSPANVREWDEFVEQSRNATFLHLRGYMDYHADRFADHSLMARKEGRLLALLPANLTVETIDGTEVRTLRSHQGLTYGGWLLPPRHLDGNDMLHIFRLLAEHCRAEGVAWLDYRPVPFIYAAMPSQEDIYALFRMGAVQSVCNLSETVNLRANPGLNTLQRRHLKKSRALTPAPELCEVYDNAGVTDFYALLQQCLRERHEATPVHSLPELLALYHRFRENIRIFTVRRDGRTQAGVCIYDTGRVAHCQYIASTPEARKLNLLTPLMVWLMEEVFATREYFDFGTSNEDDGRVLNSGLLRQKSSLGGSGVAYQRFMLAITPDSHARI